MNETSSFASKKDNEWNFFFLLKKTMNEISFSYFFRKKKDDEHNFFFKKDNEWNFFKNKKAQWMKLPLQKKKKRKKRKTMNELPFLKIKDN